MTQDDILTALDAAGLGNRRDEAAKLLVPALRLTTIPTADDLLPIGASKMGGEPDLPISTPWPCWNGSQGDLETSRPLHFLAQINFADAHALMPDTLLPSSGLLSIFYDAEEQPWGRPDEGGFQVVYTPDDATLETCKIPEAWRALLDSPQTFNPCALRFAAALPLHPLWALRTSHKESAALDKLMKRFDGGNADFGGNHQMLGIAAFIQGEVPFDLALDEMGLTYQDLQGEEGSALLIEIADKASRWRLLLQIDTDDTESGKPGWMWGDSGMLYFHIHERDLAIHNFDNVRMTLQCC